VTRKKAPVPSAMAEFEGAELGDARRAARLLKFVEAMQDNPAAGFPRAARTIAEREANYRLLNNERVEMDALLAPHVRQTVARVKAQPGRPLLLVDTTEFVFAGEADREGLDRLGANRQGFDAFVALATTETRQPLGVVSISTVEGKGRVGAEEWAGAVDGAAERLSGLDPICVIDREGDAYALFAFLIATRRDFVIRVAHDRWVREHDGAAKELLRAIAARAPILLEREVKLSRRTKIGKAPDARRRHPPREGRDATLTVRATTVTLPRPPKQRAPLPSSLEVHLVQVLEENPPAGEPPVEWLLFTTLPIADAAAVGRIVDAYRARWTIEEYFKALKSGCAYEQRQLESRHALLNALGILAPLAWRLLAMRSVGDADCPASSFLDEDELHVLRKLSHDVKLGPSPRAADALLAIALLGGHFKQNGRPGWKVIWAGFQKVLDTAKGYRLARGEM
jgi:hypothetical protein